MRILDEDRTRQTGMAQQTALKANTPGKKPKGGPNATKGKCRNCGKKGHYEKDCWAKGGGTEGQALAWFKQPKEKDSAKQSKDANFAFAANNEIALATISARIGLLIQQQQHT